MSDTRFPALFNPFTLDHLSLNNRIVMAPMTRMFSPGHVPGDDVAAYYRRWAIRTGPGRSAPINWKIFMPFTVIS